MIYVTKPAKPSIYEIVKSSYSIMRLNNWTNFGRYHNELINRLKNELGIDHFMLSANGTVPLHLILHYLKTQNTHKMEVITTPFTYVATTSSILWEGLNPVFVDIFSEMRPTIDYNLVRSKINSSTLAILATHVYGIPCHVEELENISREFNIPVIYDAAHALGVKYKGKSVLSYGSCSTVSMHATKLFHTAEGGGYVTQNVQLQEALLLLSKFGHTSIEEYSGYGINGKMSDWNAILGLAILKRNKGIAGLINSRKLLADSYDKILSRSSKLFCLKPNIDVDWNYSYYPVVFQSENEMLEFQNYLMDFGISTRRYFYPITPVAYEIVADNCVKSEDLSKRILCLPMSSSYTKKEKKVIMSALERVI